MSAVKRDNLAFFRAIETPVHTLFVGADLQTANQLFQRKVEAVRSEHVAQIDSARDAIVSQAKVRPFDCVMVDLRKQEAGDPEDVLRLAKLGSFGTLVVLANEQNAGVFEDVWGIATVLVAPVQPIDIVKTIVAAAPQPEVPGQNQSDTKDTGPDDQSGHDSSPPLAPSLSDLDDAAQPQPHDIQPTTIGDDKSDWWSVSENYDQLKNELAPGLSKLNAIDKGIWRRFVPLISFIYKKLAIVLLSALFLTFVAYGAMIIFFLSNDNWSMPFELSRGHVLVEKVERDLSSLNLRRNDLHQDLTSVTAELEIARRAERDGELRLLLTRRTLAQEIKAETGQRDELLNQIARLNKIVDDFDKFSGKKNFSRDLKRAYAKRLITKDELNKSTLSILETMHRLVVVDGEIASKKLAVQGHETSLKFLNALQLEIDRPELKHVLPTNAEFANLARQIIETKAQTAAARTALASAGLRSAQLEHSFEVISKNLHSLEKTPAARAMIAPVTVLFVPYDNADSVQAGDPLYGCALNIFFCSRVGTVGKAIDGETASVHPLFSKPMRGSFVEAKFEDAKSGKVEIVHSGSAPLWF